MVPAENIKPNVAGQLCIVTDKQGVQHVRFILRALSGRTYKVLKFGDDKVEEMELVAATPVLWIKT